MTDVVGVEEFFRMDGLTGTNLQYHLLGDLMVDDDNNRREWKRHQADNREKSFAATKLKLGDKFCLNIVKNSNSAGYAKAVQSSKCYNISDVHVDLYQNTQR